MIEKKIKDLGYIRIGTNGNEYTYTKFFYKNQVGDPINQFVMITLEPTMIESYKVVNNVRVANPLQVKVLFWFSMLAMKYRFQERRLRGIKFGSRSRGYAK